MAFPGEALQLQLIERRDSAGDALTCLRVTNNATETLAANWRLYFSLGLTPTATETRVNQVLLDGRYGYLEPTPDWPGLEAGDSIELSVQNWLFAHTHMISRHGFHFSSWDASRNEEQVSVPVTEPAELLPLQLANSWIRDFSPTCDTEPDTPEHRFEVNNRSYGSDPQAVIPRVSNLMITGDVITFDGLDYSDDELDKVLNNWKNDAGLPVEVINEGEPDTYSVDSTNQRITIRSGSPTSTYHAAQTLRQLLKSGLRQVSLTDQPDFEHRGLFIDIARHFHSAEALKPVISAMAAYKMNRLQLGISNDEGWRLEIDGLPELTEVGARRSFKANDESGTPRGLYPAWGDGAEESLAFLTREEFVDLLQFANRHHVEIIPEFNLPAHANALIRAMEATGRYQVTDPDDRSSHKSAQGYTNNVVNVCLDDTYHLAEQIISSIAECYIDAGLRLRSLHLGGDEVPAGSWQRSPACEVKTTDELLKYYAQRICDVAMSVDEDILLGFWHEMSPAIEGIPNTYITGWTTEAADRGKIDGVIQRDQSLVIANASFLYLDMPHSLHADEPGLPWASYLDCERIQQFEPLACWQIEQRDSVRGIQAQLWTETVNDTDALHYYLFPRLLAVADRAWREAPGSWPAFATAVGSRETAHLDELEVSYRIPPAGLRIVGGELHANVNLPGLVIRYTLDGSEPDALSPVLTSPLKINVGDDIRVAVFSGNRSGRVEVIYDLLNTVVD